MKILQKIRTSFTTQLMSWVAAFVLVISGVVLLLLVQFSQNVIYDETTDATMQALENTALRINNTLRQTEMMARLEHQPLQLNRMRIEQLVEESGAQATLRQLLPNAQLFVTRRDSSQFDMYITGGTGGYRRMEYDDKDVYLFSQPLGDRPFSLGVVCPAEDLFGKYSKKQWHLLSSGIAVILALLVVLYFVIARHLRPLHLLADAAESIAAGNLNTPIPDAHHQHEAGRLQMSLKKMQQPQKAYMDEMQQKRATLSQQNAELQTAYGEAQAYEELKAKFLQKMTDRMVVPVELLCLSTQTICRDYTKLSKEDIASLQADIMQGTETITELLDQLIKDPAAS